MGRETNLRILKRPTGELDIVGLFLVDERHLSQHVFKTPGVHVVGRVDLDAHAERPGHCGAYRAKDSNQELGPALWRTSKLVGTLVARRRQELGEKESVCV
jgi:hypothetical protein